MDKDHRDPDGGAALKKDQDRRIEYIMAFLGVSRKRAETMVYGMENAFTGAMNDAREASAELLPRASSVKVIQREDPQPGRVLAHRDITPHDHAIVVKGKLDE